MQQQPPQMQIPIDKTSGVLCTKCNNDLFTERLMLRKVSKFVAATPNDVIIPINVLVCANCGELNEEILPPELKTVVQRRNTTGDVPSGGLTAIKGNINVNSEDTESGFTPMEVVD